MILLCPVSIVSEEANIMTMEVADLFELYLLYSNLNRF